MGFVANIETRSYSSSSSTSFNPGVFTLTNRSFRSISVRRLYSLERPNSLVIHSDQFKLTSIDPIVRVQVQDVSIISVEVDDI